MPSRKPPFPRALAPIEAPLPAPIAASIGTTIARHSYLDWVLGQVLYSLMEISLKQGRVVVRPPRAGEYVQAVRDLYAFHKIESKFDFDGLARRLERAEAARHLLARSVFMRDIDARGKPKVRLGRGPWAPMATATDRLAPPEGVVVDRAFLADRRADVESAIKAAENLQAVTDRRLRELAARRRTTHALNRRKSGV
jgi:hypothetical protein